MSFLRNSLNPFGMRSRKGGTVVVKRRFGRQRDLQLDTPHHLNHGDLSLAVRLPPGESLNGWLAVNTVDFFNQTTLLYGCLTECCTRETCRVMNAGDRYQYLWSDGVNYRRPTRLPAPDYISCMCDWVVSLLNSDGIFPVDGVSFPDDFHATISKVFRRLFRVYAHIYYSHWEECRRLDLHRHLNSCFVHFCLFGREFELIGPEEMSPLQRTIAQLMDPPQEDASARGSE